MLITVQYCIGSATDQHESATGVQTSVFFLFFFFLTVLIILALNRGNKS